MPDKSILVAVQYASVSVAIVKVMLEAGLTLNVIGLVAPLKAAPFDKVPFHGPVPVNVIVRLVFCDGHIEAVPEMMPVGRGRTVIAAALALAVMPLPSYAVKE